MKMYRKYTNLDFHSNCFLAITEHDETLPATGLSQKNVFNHTDTYCDQIFLMLQKIK